MGDQGSTRQPISGSARFSAAPRFVLVVAFLLLVISITVLLYRAILPTDGWSVYTTDIEPADFLYDRNLVGATSGLQSNDRLLSVNGLDVSGMATTAYMEPPPHWGAGQEAVFGVERDGTPLEITVPIVNWTWLAFWRYNFASLVRIIGNLGALLLLGLGWFTFLRRFEVPSARALLMLTTSLGVAYISGSLPDGLSVQFNRLAFVFTVFFSYIIFGVLLAPSLLAFSLLFPRPKQAIERRPWLALLPFGYGALLLLMFLFGAPGQLGWISTMAMFVLSLLSLIHSWLTQRDAVSRAQMHWAIGGFVLGLGLFMLNFPLGFGLISDPILLNVIGVASQMSIVVIGFCLAMAVLRYRLYDIDVIIRKTLVYAVLTGLLALVYFIAVVALQSLFDFLTGAQSPIAIVISTLIIAALFAPLRRRVQALIDRRFFRKKVDAQQVLAAFAQTSRDETDIEALTGALVQAVDTTLQPDDVTVWLRSPRPQ